LGFVRPNDTQASPKQSNQRTSQR